jgi:hypothetical protein
MNTLPNWVKLLWKKDEEFKNMSERMLVEFIKTASGIWWDDFPVSLKGTDPRSGFAKITDTKQPAPRRMMLCSEVHGRKWSNKFKCDLEEGYGYAYRFLPEPWMGLRCLRDYLHLPELVEEVWKSVWHHLDPVSQVCPPNGINLLWYFGKFGGTGARINPHQDNGLDIIDPSCNSQLLGSSVMTINLFDKQDFVFCAMESKKNGIKELQTFRTEHGSVYILRADDDAKWKHMARFPRKKEEGSYRDSVRLAICCRWLGRRTTMYCDNCRRDDKRYREVFENPNRVIEERFPNSQEMREGFRMKRR